MVKSEIDTVYKFIHRQNPGNFKILNGFDKEHDPEMKTGPRDSRYPEAYYPYYDPELHRADGPPKPRDYSIPLNRYSNGIYQLDQQPYYGQADSFRVFNKPDVSTKRVRIFY